MKLKDEFEDVLRDVPGDITSCIMSIDVGDTKPIAQDPYRVPDKLKAKVKCKIDKLLEPGIIVPSSSPWASPIVPVLKPDSSVRLCVDYQHLNDCTLQDSYYMPTLEEFWSRLAHVVCCLNLTWLKARSRWLRVPVSTLPSSVRSANSNSRGCHSG